MLSRRRHDPVLQLFFASILVLDAAALLHHASPSPRRLRQLLSRHRRKGGPSPPTDPPSAAFASSSFTVAAADESTPAKRQNCGVCASQGVRGPSVARMQLERPCRVARAVCAVMILNKYVLIIKKPFCEATASPTFIEAVGRSA
eukprot:2785707-Prymnesium_polylepis.1